MDIGYVDKPDMLGKPDRFFDIKNTSLQDIYNMVETPEELQNKLTELTKGHPGLKNALFSMPVHEQGRDFIAKNILGGMMNDAIAGNNGKDSVKQKVNGFFTELYNMYKPGSSIPISQRSLRSFADRIYSESFQGKAEYATGQQRYEYYQQHGIPKSANAQANANAKNKGYLNQPKLRKNERARETGNTGLRTITAPVETPYEPTLDYEAPIETPSTYSEQPASFKKREIRTGLKGHTANIKAGGYTQEHEATENFGIAKKNIAEVEGGTTDEPKNNKVQDSNPTASEAPNSNTVDNSAPPNAKGTKEEIPKTSGVTGTGFHDYVEQPKPNEPLKYPPAIIPEGKQEIPAADGEVQAGNGKSAAYKDGRLDDSKEFTAERKLENEKKVLNEHNIDFSNMNEEQIHEAKNNIKKDYWNKKKAKLGGHGKAALGVGVAVTAGALVLGLSNSRGQQSNAQLYGQQPLSY